MPWRPGFAALVSDLGSPLGHTCSCLAPGCEGTAARGDQGSGVPLHGAPPSLAPPALPVPLPFATPRPWGWLLALLPSAAPALGRGSRHTQHDVNSAQPCFYTALLGKPSNHTAELLARPARLLGQGLLLLQLPNNGWRPRLSAGLQDTSWFFHQVPQLVPPCHLWHSSAPRYSQRKAQEGSASHLCLGMAALTSRSSRGAGKLKGAGHSCGSSGSWS